jgi:hypothetical protein
MTAPIIATTVPAPPYAPSDPDVVGILEFIDPVCVWCCGSEPALPALKHQYGDRVRIGLVMGGLVPDITAFADPGQPRRRPSRAVARARGLTSRQ